MGEMSARLLGEKSALLQNNGGALYPSLLQVLLKPGQLQEEPIVSTQ